MTKTRRENPLYEVVHGDSVEVLVQRKSDECDETIHGKLRNLSPEGAQILLPTYLKFQEEIELQIHIPDAEVKIEAAAEVSWIRPAEDDQCLIGCSFAEKLSESVLDRLAIARINDRRREPRHEVSTPGMARWKLDANSKIPIRITDYSEGGFCMASGRRTSDAWFLSND